MHKSDREARSASTSFLALSCVGFVASAMLPVAAVAQQADEGKATTLKGVVVTDTAIQDGPKVEKAASPKYTRPIVDTPQTITVISAQSLQQQNLLTLRDALSTVPGITFGAGEGGGGYGDSINLRGYSANTDITVDGVRDSAQYTRSDPFNLEQLEVVNGANSVYSGAGSVGGNINIVTKKPKAEDATVLQAGIGTDNYYRATVDTNWRVNDLIAFRLNAMYHENDVPRRDVEKYKRWGIAPSVTFGIDSPTRLTVQYLHQEDNNIPQYGVPYYAIAGGLPPGADYSGYYGFANLDKQRINVDQATATFEHDLSDNTTIRNLARYQNVRQFSRVDPPQGTYCLSNGLTPAGASCVVDIDSRSGGANVYNITVPTGYYLPSGPRGNTRITNNDLFYDQLDLKSVFNTGGIEHTLVFGGSVSWERFELSTGNALRAADGTNPYAFDPAAPSPDQHLPFINIANPSQVVTGPGGLLYGSNIYTGPVNYIEGSRQTGEASNYAIYLFDTLKLSEQFELNGGLRYEKAKGWFRPDTVSTATATLGAVTRGTRVNNSDSLFSYRVGLVYKPVENASLYIAYGNSKTPSKTSVNGSCTVDGVNNATASTCNVKPESAVNYEIGAKAELFNKQLLLTAAVFRNERSNYKVASNDPVVPDQQLDGKSRVNGLALGAVGRITEAWTISANYTYLDSKVIRNVAQNGATPAVDVTAGNPLTNTPKHSGSLFTTYTLPFGLQLGYGFNYQGSFYLNNGAAPLFKADDYLIHNAFLSYPVTPALTAQINVKNFTNEKYFIRIRNNGWATPGDGRSAVLSLSYTF